MLSSLEGSRGWPKVKPPFPATHGLFGCPTVVNNVETLAALPWIIENGARRLMRPWARRRARGRSSSASAVISSSPASTRSRWVIRSKNFSKKIAAACRADKKLKGVIPGGGSMPVLLPEEIDKVNLDYESVQAAGSLLGSGGVIVMDESTCMVRAALNLSAILRARVLRPMQPMPRRLPLDGEDSAPDRIWPGRTR